MYVKVKDISKKYGDRQVLNGISFSLEKHNTLSVLGESGCGKTTLLKIIAGLEQAQEGETFLDGVNITYLPCAKRNIVYLFQEDLLFPHLNVYENLAFGLRIQGKTNHLHESIHDMIANIELKGYEKKMPHELSGGQRQRVAFGRAVITNPKVLLLDEPFSSLDTGTRSRMQELFISIARTYSITSLFITHDLKEAILMGDRIAYMQKGELVMYEKKSHFINDKKTGVKEEIEFWKNLSSD